MIVASWRKQDPFMMAFDRKVACSCPVRNEFNQLRGKCEVVYTMPGHKPYQPRQFPCGKWIIGQIEPKDDRLMSPFLIRTDAWRMVGVWRLDEGGCYMEATPDLERDIGYDIHMLNASETWGCIGVKKYQDFLWLVERIRENRTSHDFLQLEVME